VDLDNEADVTRERPAHHQAGHVVASWVRGLHVDGVSISPKGNDLGRVAVPPIFECGCVDRREERRMARAHIVASYAGMAAERLHDPRSPCREDRDAETALWLSERFRVFPRRMTYVGDGHHVRYLDGLRVEARRLVRRRRRVVEAVAEVLLEQGRLGPEEIDALQRKLLGGGQ